MQVTLLGVGEAFAAEPNASALVEAEGFTVLIDCGHAAVPALWRARPDPEALDAIYLTHHHADHVLGLVPVVDRWLSEGRRRPITIVTSAWGRDHLQRLFELMGLPLDRFPVHILEAAETRAIGPFAMRVAPTRHGAPNNAVRLQSAGRTLAFSGDGRPTPEAMALYADADLLLHECYMPVAAPEWPSHCDLPAIQAIAGPARIGLYHVRDGYRDATRQAIAGDPRLFLPEAGDVLAV